MPAIGFVMPGRDGGNGTLLPFDDALTTALDDPSCPVPYAVLSSILDWVEKSKERPTKGVSVTTADGFGCLRCKILEKHTDYYLPVERAYAAWSGTMQHSVFEDAWGKVPDAICEERFYLTLPDTGILLHGAPDLIYKNRIVDLKNKEDLKGLFNPYKAHTRQLNGYKLLVSEGETEAGLKYDQDIDFLYVQYCAPRLFKTLKAKVWTMEETIAEFESSCLAYQEAVDNFLNDGKLPPYPPNFQYISDDAHTKYSDVAEICVERHFSDS